MRKPRNKRPAIGAVMALLDTGSTQKQAAAYLGVSASLISRMARDYKAAETVKANRSFWDKFRRMFRP